MRLFAPLWSRATYHGWIWLILGGALMMPFMMLGALVYNWYAPDAGFSGVIHPVVYLAVLPVVAASSLLLPDREVERTAARRLLGAEFAAPLSDDSWNARWRTGCWFTLHAAVGGLMSGITLAMVPFAVYLTFRGISPSISDIVVPHAWHRWGLVLGPLVLVALISLVAAVTAGLKRLAPHLLGEGAGDRLARARAESARLAARNRIARELHDSVGHALSVVTVQSQAAARLVDTDPAFAKRAMAAVGECASNALAELDDVLGVLREEHDGSDRAPGRNLTDLEDLVADSGVAVDLRVEGDRSALGRVTSREAYRIVQEALTNVLRHADEPSASVTVEAGPERLRITVASPASRHRRPRKGGRGLEGMRERAAVLGGTVEAGRGERTWTVRADLPLGAPTTPTEDDDAAAHSPGR
jgi:signal transduction histidine kinase